MYAYMDYLQRCYYKATGWDHENGFAHISALSRAILDFTIPDGVRVECSNRAAECTASSFTLTRDSSVNGSLAYLYSSKPLNAADSKTIPLQEAVAGFRVVSLPESRNQAPSRKKDVPDGKSPPSLVYARMYFPGAALEAMVIRRISESAQILLKCVSNPHVRNSGALVAYFQTNTARFLREVIFSSNDALLGFRCLYSCALAPGPSPKFDNSVLSFGSELWYAARTLSPGFSLALRYYTCSTATGKPLTMTLAANPILGHISSTYTVKTSVGSTVSSRYDFNCFSYASNLIVGFEFFRPPYGLPARKPRSTAFHSLISDTVFGSVFKCAADLNARSIRCLWEGRCNNFLVSAGVKMGVCPETLRPEVGRIGVNFAYAC